MSTRENRTGRTTLFVGGVAALAVFGAGTAVAAKQITSYDIKDGTIQTRDLTKNNFGRFTGTETVVSATTAGGKVPVAAGAETPLVTMVLDKGTWKINGEAQFWHDPQGARPSGLDIGQVTMTGLQDGFGTSFTADVPDDGAHAAQAGLLGTIKVPANDTVVTITGSFTGDNSGLAGVTVQATQYVYAKQ
jgi:hypothetical protein